MWILAHSYKLILLETPIFWIWRSFRIQMYLNSCWGHSSRCLCTWALRLFFHSCVSRALKRPLLSEDTDTQRGRWALGGSWGVRATGTGLASACSLLLIIRFGQEPETPRRTHVRLNSKQENFSSPVFVETTWKEFSFTDNSLKLCVMVPFSPNLQTF